MTYARCRICLVPLRDPISRRRGYGPDHDPNPELRRTIRVVRTAQTGFDLLQQLQEDDQMAVTVDADGWRKRCESHQCVEVRGDTERVQIRDAAGTVIIVSPGAWRAFIARL